MTLGLVCARKGSRGAPDKNIRELDGERLIERAIRIAYAAGCDDVVVSTDYRPNVDFDTQGAYVVTRPKSLAGPEVGKWPVYQHAVRAWESQTGRTVEVAVDVDVSRPLRTAATVRACYRAAREHGAAMAVAESDKHPGFDIMRWNGGVLAPYDNTVHYTARQQTTATYLHAGCYAMTREALFGRGSFLGGYVHGVETDRIESFDIDDELDWRVVSLLDAYPPIRVTANAA